MYSCSIHYTRMIVKFVPAGLLEGGGGGGGGGLSTWGNKHL